EVLADMRRRDAGDASRNISPLRPADDAVVLNTTGNSFERSLALLEELVSQTLAENPPQSKEAPLC
ncbi:MAG: (d)CMP kinase, partial [Oscillospiraceae bacterium]|nr:(d)CMP kinase [Oscillospiraceae bacterium]